MKYSGMFIDVNILNCKPIIFRQPNIKNLQKT